MKSIYLAGSLMEAELFRDRLRQSGIDSMVKNREIQGALGELPLSLLPEVWILDDKDLEAAQDEAQAFEARRKQDSGPDKICNHCQEENPGNFELCWKCRAEL